MLPMKLLRAWPCIAMLAAAAAWPTAAAARLTLMHGYADVASALVWIQAERAGPIEVTWQAEGESGERALAVDAIAANDMVVVARLDGLRPGSQARYRVRGDGEVREGTVRAQAWWRRPEEARDFTIAIGSCFYLGTDGPWSDAGYGGEFGIFDSIAAKAPDLMLWLGDTLYLEEPDFLNPASMAASYRRQRAFPQLQRLLTAAPNLAIWDDHDYGPNDADASYVMKGAALETFKRYWPNPTHGLPGVPGVFGAVRIGDVDLFLLDDRWYRSANGSLDGPDKTMLGSAQLAWLRNALTWSRAPIKIVANGSQLFNRISRFEGWHQFATEQRAFLDWLAAQRIDGLLFLSGDRHFGELLRIERPGAYPLVEFTSSPLTSRGWDQPERPERENPDLVPGTLFSQRQFGLIRVSGPGNDRRLALETYDSRGTLVWRQELSASALKHPRTPP